jgi:hypothetical protein
MSAPVKHPVQLADIPPCGSSDIPPLFPPGFEYCPPIETCCAHGKTLGPCPICTETFNREQRAARRGP